MTQLSFNSGLVWNIDAGNTLRWTVSRGAQLPSLVFLGAYLSLEPPLTGDPDNRPTVVTNYEIEWGHTLLAPEMHLHASVFHQRSDDLAALAGGSLTEADGTTFLVHTNVGSSNMSGLELAASGVLAQHWRWGMSYRFETISQRLDPSPLGALGFVEYEHTTPKHMLKSNIGWAQSKWELDGYLYYQSHANGLTPADAGGTVLTPIPAYISVDARIGYRINRWATLALSGQNLATNTQRQTSGPAVQRRVLGSLTIGF